MTTATRARRQPRAGSAWQVFGAAARGIRWYWSGITGADAYERYVAHLGRAHPACPVPTKREFWREKYAEQERNPTQRCC